MLKKFLVVVWCGGRVIRVSALFLSLRDKERLSDWEIDRDMREWYCILCIFVSCLQGGQYECATFQYKKVCSSSLIQWTSCLTYWNSWMNIRHSKVTFTWKQWLYLGEKPWDKDNWSKEVLLTLFDLSNFPFKDPVGILTSWHWLSNA